MRLRLPTALLAAILAAAAPAAIGQAGFPDKPVRIVAPFPSSGPADVFARLYAARLAERWKRAVFVENRAGATGTIGTDAVVKAAPDGYTLLFTVDLPIVMAPALVKMPYDPQRDLAPVAMVADGMNLLAVHPSTGVSDLAGLVAAARAKPGELTYSSAGNASPGHICGALLGAAADARLTHVPYKGAAPAAQAVLSGEVSMFCGPIHVTLPHVRSGKLRAIGVTGTNASALAPEIAPLAQTIPSVVITNWYAFFAPRGTPPALVERIRADLKAVSEENEVRARLPGLGLEPRWADAEGIAAAIATDLARWQKVVRDADIKPE